MTMWTNDNVAELALLLDKGLSCSKIGAKLNMTRNAIVGKIHRLRKAGNMPRVLPKPEAAARASMMPTLRPWKPHAPHLHPRPGYIEPEVVMTANPVTLMELERRHCRWPLGNDTRDPHMLYCGDPILDGYSYCQHHCDRAYQRAPNRAQPVSGALLRLAYEV